MNVELLSVAEEQGNASFPPVRWMVVDDNPGLGEILAALLGAIAKVEVHVFRSGVEALVALDQAPGSYKFIATDLEMPGMSGIELCRHIHARDTQMPVLLTTGSGVISHREALDYGFCGLLNKPFPLQALQQMLSMVGVYPRRVAGTLIPALAGDSIDAPPGQEEIKQFAE